MSFRYFKIFSNIRTSTIFSKSTENVSWYYKRIVWYQNFQILLSFSNTKNYLEFLTSNFFDKANYIFWLQKLNIIGDKSIFCGIQCTTAKFVSCLLMTAYIYCQLLTANCQLLFITAEMLLCMCMLKYYIWRATCLDLLSWTADKLIIVKEALWLETA